MNGGYASKPYNPHVHMHLIPRHDHDLDSLGLPFHDELFGNHYTLSTEYQLSDEDRNRLTGIFRKKNLDAWG